MGGVAVLEGDYLVLFYPKNILVIFFVEQRASEREREIERKQ